MLTFVTLDDLEPWLVNKAAHLLINLIRRKELIQQDELTIQWRPLYDLYERLLYSPFETLGMMQLPR